MKIGQYTLLAGFLVTLFTFGFLSIVNDDNEISYYESRTLAQKPTFSLEKWNDASFAKELDGYYADQFIGRQSWIYVNTVWQHMIPGVYTKNHLITDEGIIMDKPRAHITDEELEMATSSLLSFDATLEKQNIPLYLGLMPAKINALDHVYPSFLPEGHGEDNLSRFHEMLGDGKVQEIDMYTTFMKEKTAEERETLYFKTDHHWNMDGAFLAYRDIINTLSKDFDGLGETYTKETVSQVCADDKGVVGSWNKQVSMMVDSSDDKPCVYLPKTFDFNDLNIYVGAVAEENKKDADALYGRGIYTNMEKIDYGLAFSADYSEINIINEKAKNDTHIMILKDSYFNPMVLHVASHFNKTTVLDTRHLKNTSAYEEAIKQGVDVVVVLYNNSNLSGEMYTFEPVPTN